MHLLERVCMQDLTEENFFKTLFPEEGAATCFTDTLQGTKVQLVASRPSPLTQRFTINCLHPTMDLRPQAHYHRADKPRRANHNVIVYRNFLVEMDGLPKVDQLEWALRTKFPFTSAVDSGGKSIHFIISLERPLKSERSYRRLCERIERACRVSGVEIDSQTKAPSQLSRCPNVQRTDVDKETGQLVDKGFQELLVLRKQVSLKELRNWLYVYKPKAGARQSTKRKLLDLNQIAPKHISHKTRKLIENLEFEGASRHAALKTAAVQLYKSGHEIDEVEAILAPVASALIPERDDLSGILRWVERAVIPEVNLDE